MSRMLTVLLLLVVAAISNAMMDTSVHHNGGGFCHAGQSAAEAAWWNCNGQSWLNKYKDGKVENGRRTVEVGPLNLPYPVQLTDAFHFFKTLMIFAFCAIIALYFIDLKRITKTVWMDFLIYWTLAGTLWNMTFGLFYGNLLR